MIEIAHFIQFFSFSFGLIAIYICINIYNQFKYKAIKTYLQVLIGINLIIFAHVIEAFLKVVYSEAFYIDYFYSNSFYILSFFTLIRIFIAYKFIVFSMEVINKKIKNSFYPIAVSTFILFIIMRIILNNETGFNNLIDKLSVFSIHALLFLAIAYSSYLLWTNKESNKIIDSKIYNAIILFIILYAVLGIGIRIPGISDNGISMNSQMLLLGLLSLIFNLSNVIYLKKVFKLPMVNSKQDVELNILFNKYNITKREQEIVLLLCMGKTNKEIAEKLFISPITVRDHNSNIFRKTNVKNRTQLAGLFQNSITKDIDN